MTMLKLIRLLLIALPVIWWSQVTTPAFAFSVNSTDGKDKLRVEPYLNYRQAAVQLRKESSLFNPEKDRDYIDQLYVTVKLVKEVSDSAIAAVEPAFFSLRENPSQLSFRIDQAFIDATVGNEFHLIGGKRVESRGVGSIFSPSDLLNENQDFIDPLVRREGKNLTRIEWRSSNLKLGFGYIPSVSRPWRDGKLWFLAEASLFESDFGLQLTQNDKRKVTAGFSGVRFFGESFEVHIDGRLQSRQNSAVDQVEREFSNVPDNSGSHQLVAGSRIVMTSSASVVGEYIKNSSGLNPSELQRYYASQIEKKANSQVPDDPFARLVGREYAALSAYDDKLFSKFRASISAILNLRDSSTFVSLNAKYRPSSLITLGYSPLWFSGAKLTEFGENPLKSIHYLTLESLF